MAARNRMCVVETGSAREVVRLFEHDAELAGRIDERRLAQIRRHATADAISFAAGSHFVFAPGHAEHYVAAIVLEGLVARRVTVAGRHSVELLGRGDVLRPWQDDGLLASLPSATGLRAVEPTRLAFVDRDILSLAGCVEVMEELMARCARRGHDLGARLAIAQMPRLEQRLVALFWHLADRWGRVEPQGVHIPLRLSHDVLAELVSAQRPSVSLALAGLARAGRLERSSGGWTLLEPAGTLKAAESSGALAMA